MLPSPLPENIARLSTPEKLELVTALWDDIAEASSQTPLSEQQRAEIDARLAAREAAPNAGEPWQKVRTRLLSGS